MKNKGKYHSRVDESVLTKLTEAFRDSFRALGQLVENCADWHAQHIVIRLLKIDGQASIQVVDDGSGFTDAGISAFISLGESDAKNDPNKKGLNGTGAKGAVQHCDAMVLETKRSDSDLITMRYTINDFVDMLFHGRDPEDFVKTKRLPPRHDIKTTGSVVTWIGLKSSPSKWTAKAIIDNLARFLYPQVADKVIVEDCMGPTPVRAPLKARELIGKRIKGSANVPGVGVVNYDLAVAARPQPSGERVRVGSLGPVCTWEEFASPITHLPGAERITCRAILAHPQVMGEIDIPPWNKQFARNSREGGFTDNLYDEGSPVWPFFSWIRTELVPRIESEIGLKESEISSDKFRQIFNEIARGIQERTGACTPPRTVKPIDWHASPRRVTLEPGDDIVIELRDVDGHTDFDWDASESGGTLDQKTGTRVQFVAGPQTGEYVIIVRSRSSGQSRKIAVNIKDELPFGISPPAVTLGPGEERTLRVMNHKRTSGRFNWTAGVGGRLEVQDGGLTAVFTAGPAPAECMVVCEDAKQPTRFRATATVQVTDEGPNPSENDNELAFRINDHLYRIRDTAYSRDVKDHSSQLAPGKSYSSISINTNHDAFRASSTTKPSIRTYVLREVAFQAAIRENPTASLERIMCEQATILAMICPLI